MSPAFTPGDEVSDRTFDLTVTVMAR